MMRGASTSDKIEPVNNSNEELVHTPQISIGGTSSPDAVKFHTQKITFESRSYLFGEDKVGLYQGSPPLKK